MYTCTCEYLGYSQLVCEESDSLLVATEEIVGDGVGAGNIACPQMPGKSR
jgi:hypothetical protein